MVNIVATYCQVHKVLTEEEVSEFASVGQHLYNTVHEACVAQVVQACHTIRYQHTTKVINVFAERWHFTGWFLSKQVQFIYKSNLNFIPTI